MYIWRKNKNISSFCMTFMLMPLSNLLLKKQLVNMSMMLPLKTSVMQLPDIVKNATFVLKSYISRCFVPNTNEAVTHFVERCLILKNISAFCVTTHNSRRLLVILLVKARIWLQIYVACEGSRFARFSFNPNSRQNSTEQNQTTEICLTLSHRLTMRESSTE